MMSVTGAILRVKRHINYNVIVEFHQSYALNQKWRKRHGLTSNPTTFGPLTNLPDYSFKDGRPTPVGTRQLTRMQIQREYAERIITLVSEVDYAVERHARLEEEKKQKRQQILDDKLKPKGNLLL